jgi:pantoate--beta-alanine ligase
MRTVVSIAELRAHLAERRRTGDRIALVPTMGFLHEGHLALVDEARRRASCVVMSIFVNPLQFGPNEDLTRYPRDPEGDAAKAEARGVDMLFSPDEREVYPMPRRIIEVRATALADRWEGAVRPGHFAGVLTVVAKLFNIAQPDVAIFGQKDIQQATLVRALVRELDFPLELVVIPTVREPDGLAMSSRNSYLSAQDRRHALVLSRSLRAIAAAFGAGERHAAALARIGQDELAAVPAAQVDYLAIVDPVRMEPVREAVPGTIVAIAARVGPTRLIDNVILEAP